MAGRVYSDESRMRRVEMQSSTGEEHSREEIDLPNHSQFFFGQVTNNYQPMRMSEMTYACDHEGCNEIFLNNFELGIHIRNHPKELPCTTCNRRFYRKYDLENHIQAHHNPNIRHTCGNCQKQFRTMLSHWKHTSCCKQLKRKSCRAGSVASKIQAEMPSNSIKRSTVSSVTCLINDHDLENILAKHFGHLSQKS